MKKIILSGLLSALFFSVSFAQYGTTRTGYEGDYFSLEGAIDLFKQSHSLRDFERKLNTEEYWVNNLDLNYDGRIDYIRVEHRRQRDYHAVILQAVVDRYDVQDVAVIEIEITGRREAILQIVGDEDLYGEEVIVEPREGYTDSRRGNLSDYNDYVNVYYWEPVQYILGRSYQVYRSPYRWQYYPTWWNPWVQCSWNIFRPRIVVYHRHYHVVHRHRVIHVHNFYRSYRSYSPIVVQRANTVRVKQGKSPIHRPPRSAQQNRNSSGYRNNNDIVDRSRNAGRSNTTRQIPAESKNKSLPADDRNVGRSSIPRTDQRSRSTENRSGTLRSTTPGQSPATKSRNSTPSTRERTTTRSTSPQLRSSTPTRTTTRSSGTIKRSSGDSRSTPAAKPNVSRSRSSVPNVRQAPRQEATRSRTSTRSSSTISRSSPSRSSSSTRSSTPARSKATKSIPAGKSKTKSSSRSRSGGGA